MLQCGFSDWFTANYARHSFFGLFAHDALPSALAIAGVGSDSRRPLSEPVGFRH